MAATPGFPWGSMSWFQGGWRMGRWLLWNSLAMIGHRGCKRMSLYRLCRVLQFHSLTASIVLWRSKLAMAELRGRGGWWCWWA